MLRGALILLLMCVVFVFLSVRIHAISESGEPGKILTIPEEELTSLEQEDMEENETQKFVDKQYDLLVKTSKNGLQADSKYLFRLTASCPCAEQTERSSNSSETENSTEDTLKQKFVVSSVDIVVTTNALPILKQLKVTPKSGQALKTLFTFHTKKPENCSAPLLYKYGIIANNKHIFLAQQYDSTNIETLLPFQEEPIGTVLEVCDSKNACNLTLGPKVIVKFPNNFTTTEIDVLLKQFNKSISEQDYYNAFTLSSMLLQTISNGKFDTKDELNKIQQTIKNITKNEIHILLNAKGDSWLQSASNLLKSIKMVDSQVQLPEDILNDILALRDKISEKQNTLLRKKRQLTISGNELKEQPTAINRKLLSLQITNSKKFKRIVNNMNIDEIKDYLEISELAIKRLTDFERVKTEKQKLKEKLQHYIPRICQFLYNNYKTNLQIELSTIIFEVEKINLVRKYNEFIYIPYQEMNLHGKIQIGRELAEKYRRQNGVCIGKILFLEDYFDIPQYVYDVKLFTALTDNYLDTETSNFGIVIEMPVKSFATNDETYQCVLWESNHWDMTKCKTIEESRQTVRCSCSNMGAFSIIPIERTTATTESAGSNILQATSTSTRTNPERVTQDDNANVAVTAVLTVNPYIVTTQNNEFQVYTTTQKQITTQQSLLETSQQELFQSTTKTDQTVEQKNNYKTLTPNVQTAAVWSISFLSVGIGVLIVAFCILMRKMQRSKAVQSFQTVEYAKYFDEQNLE